MAKNKSFEFLGEILSKLYLLKEQREIIEEILIFVSNVSDCIRCSLFMLKNNPKKILYEYTPVEKKFIEKKSTVKLGSDKITDVLSKREPIYLKNSKVDFLDSSSSLDSETILLPLEFLNDIQGILFVQKRNFSQREISRLRSLSSTIAFLILNSRLYENMNSLLKDLRISYEISTALIEKMNLDSLIERIFEEIRTHFGFKILGIFFLDEEGNLRLEYTVEENKEFKGIKIKANEGIIGYTVRTGEPFYAPDVRKVPFYIEGVKGILSEFAIPLKFKDRTIGVLDIESKKFDDFPDSTRKLLVSLAALIAISIENARLFEETEKLSKIDMLTGVLNRRSIELELEKLLKICKLERKNIILFFIDLDHFKDYNDRFGHQKGDNVLKILCDTIKKEMKEGICGRYGGDEFICVFFNKEKGSVLKIASELLKNVESSKFLKGITLSIGVSSYPDDGKTIDDLIRIADKRCYNAKKLGGNRINY